jgi:uncharacterized protein YehS (DUF1456 family)
LDNNDIFRRLRYTFDFNDAKMIELFSLAGHVVNRAQISDWLKKEEDTAFQILPDTMLAVFLNGLIVDKRGKREGNQPIPEETLDNNIILKKLKIALDLQTDDIVALFNAIGKKISMPEVTSFLRNPKQAKYRPCNDQYLRNFLSSLQAYYRGE